ncbi:MAG: hypothetical protein GKR87_16380 [Kiritimatiellae bacterium]|nr:hypothetical protein [Kiritimatiellia bacterium]
MLKGAITHLKKQKARINIGAEDGILLGSKYVVIASETIQPPHQSGSLIKLDNGQFVELKITKVEENFSEANIFPRKGQTLIQEGDLIYAR